MSEQLKPTLEAQYSKIRQSIDRKIAQNQKSHFVNTAAFSQPSAAKPFEPSQSSNSQAPTPVHVAAERKLDYERSPVPKMGSLDQKHQEQSIGKIASTLQLKLDEKARKLAMLREELTEMANKEDEMNNFGSSGLQSRFSQT